MKNVFLAHIVLPEVYTAEYYRLEAQQRKLIKRLMEKRTVLTYALDMERRNVWCVLEVDNLLEAEKLVHSFPIARYVTIGLRELAFHDIAPLTLPELILN